MPEQLVSDTLSRSYLNNIKSEFDENILIQHIYTFYPFKFNH